MTHNLAGDKPTKTTQAHVRWMLPRDLDSVIQIENKSFRAPWSQDDFLWYLSRRSCVGVVAELDGAVVGFMIYELRRQRVCIVNLAVDPLYQRHGVASQIVDNLVCKLPRLYKSKITVKVREGNLAAQLFFRDCGFIATKIVHSHYKDNQENAYVFQFEV